MSYIYLYDWLGLLGPELATILPSDVENGDRLGLDTTLVIALFMIKNYEGHMYVGITSNVLRPSVHVLDTGVRLHHFRTSFIAIKWRGYICPIHNMSFRSASNRPVQVVGKITLLVQLLIDL